MKISIKEIEKADINIYNTYCRKMLDDNTQARYLVFSKLFKLKHNSDKYLDGNQIIKIYQDFYPSYSNTQILAEIEKNIIGCGNLGNVIYETSECELSYTKKNTYIYDSNKYTTKTSFLEAIENDVNNYEVDVNISPCKINNEGHIKILNNNDSSSDNHYIITYEDASTKIYDNKDDVDAEVLRYTEEQKEKHKQKILSFSKQLIVDNDNNFKIWITYNA